MADENTSANLGDDGFDDESKRNLMKALEIKHAQFIVEKIRNDERYFNEAMTNAQKEMADRHKDETLSPEDATAELFKTLTQNPGKVSPSAVQEHAANLDAVDIRDVLALLVPPKEGESEVSLDDPRIDELNASLPPQITLAMKTMRLEEQRDGIPSEGSLFDRIKSWAASDDGKNAINKGVKSLSWGLMATALVTSGGAAAPAMLATHALRKATADYDFATSMKGLRGKVSNWLVGMGVFNQETMDRCNEKIDQTQEKMSESNVGKWLKIGGTMAVLGAVAVGVNYGVDGLWNAEASMPDTDGGEGAPDTPDENDAGASEPEEDKEVEATPSAKDASVVDENGNINRDALVASMEEHGGASKTMVAMVNNMPENMTAEDIVRLTTTNGFGTHTLESTLESMASTDVLPANQRDEIIAVLQSEIERQAPSTAEYSEVKTETVEASGSRGAPNFLGGEPYSALNGQGGGSPFTNELNPNEPMKNAVDGIVSGDNQSSEKLVADQDFTQPQDPHSAEGNGVASESANAEAASVSVVVPSGSTVSEEIYRYYTEELGLNVSAADLYTDQGELSTHPNGLVGEVAELNGMADPDVIGAGESINIPVPASETSLTPTPEASASDNSLKESQERLVGEKALTDGEGLSINAVTLQVVKDLAEASSLPGIWEDSDFSKASIDYVTQISAASEQVKEIDPEAIKAAEAVAENAIASGVLSPEVKQRVQDLLPALAIGASTVGIAVAAGAALDHFSKKKDSPEEKPETEGAQQEVAKDGVDGVYLERAKHLPKNEAGAPSNGQQAQQDEGKNPKEKEKEKENDQDAYGGIPYGAAPGM